MVWIFVGTFSAAEFNAIKKNTLQVYPLGAKQYVNSAWENVTAWSYQGGEWKNWFTYIYNSGNEFTERTGGLQEISLNKYSNGVVYTHVGIVRNESNIYLSAPASGGESSFVTANKIDVTNFTKLCIKVSDATAVQTGVNPYFGLFSEKSPGKCVANTTFKNGVSELSIESITGSHHIAVVLLSSGITSCKATVEAVWLER